jgi:hypothetical protein
MPGTSFSERERLTRELEAARHQIVELHEELAALHGDPKVLEGLSHERLQETASALEAALSKVCLTLKNNMKRHSYGIFEGGVSTSWPEREHPMNVLSHKTTYLLIYDSSFMNSGE